MSCFRKMFASDYVSFPRGQFVAVWCQLAVWKHVKNLNRMLQLFYTVEASIVHDVDGSDAFCGPNIQTRSKEITLIIHLFSSIYESALFVQYHFPSVPCSLRPRDAFSLLRPSAG